MIPMILRESASAEVSWGEVEEREGGREGGREKGNSCVDSVGTDIPVLHLPGFLWYSVVGQSE